MANQSAGATLGIAFGYVGGGFLVIASFINSYFLPSLYGQTAYFVGYACGAMACIGATLALANKPLAGGGLLLGASLAAAAATVVLALPLNLLVGAVFAGVAGVLAIHAARRDALHRA